ncbi:unnamed protein product [Prorocentrum cordatum]|uniref:Secreted protein n=1 Tax=Prorocentrum cordatum TaxID=2364126 RepID=A0ABN9T543_9DINO|nr:unnamed protein product [Polarella glacialis]
MLFLFRGSLNVCLLTPLISICFKSSSGGGPRGAGSAHAVTSFSTTPLLNYYRGGPLASHVQSAGVPTGGSFMFHRQSMHAASCGRPSCNDRREGLCFTCLSVLEPQTWDAEEWADSLHLPEEVPVVSSRGAPARNRRRLESAVGGHQRPRSSLV